MKVLINRVPKTGPWGGGALFVNAFFKYAPEFDVQLGTKINQPYDAIFIIDPRADELGVGLQEIQRYKLFKPGVKIFQRVNECDARKNTTDMDPMLHESSKLNDHTFFVSDWMQGYHMARNWACGSTSVVYNGVEKTIFKPNLKFKNGKTNIVTHHWSDNPYKGEDVHLWLDRFVAANPEFSYTYIGRTKAEMKNSKIIEPLWGNDLGQELGKYDIYITGTVQDPGPNHVIEAIACGIPTYAHKRGGGAVEFVGADHVYDSVESLELIIRSAEHKKNSMTPNDWRSCVEEYINKMQEVLNVKA